AATGFNSGATHEAGEPAAPENSMGKSMWWTWTAPVSGPVTIDLSNSELWFPVTVYSGSTLAGLQLEAASEGTVTFTAVQGRTYQISVSDTWGLTGEIRWTLEAPTIDAPLANVRSQSKLKAVLDYSALPGESLQLLKSSDGVNWRNIQTATTHG